MIFGSKSGHGDVALRDFDGNVLSSQTPDCINHLRWHLTLTLVLGLAIWSDELGLFYVFLNTVIFSFGHFSLRVGCVREEGSNLSRRSKRVSCS